LKRLILTLLKYSIPLAIIAWLVASVDREDWARLRHQEHNWPMLAAGFALTFLAVALTFYRWYLLVRALNLPFRLADAFRLGFLGYLLTFVSAGSVGGDLFKAVFIAHEQPGRRAEAVATVLIDRVAGMFALFVVASAAVLIAGPHEPSPLVAWICNLTLIATAAGLVGVGFVLVPPHTSELLLAISNRIPKIGVIAARLIVALQIYRSKPLALLHVLLVSLSVHTLLTISLHTVAVALLRDAPSIGEHFIIVPLSMVAAALPITPAGMGPYEWWMDQLYRLLPSPPCQDGLLVALAYRLITIVIAMIGVVYYWSSRREVRQLLEEAEHEQEELSHEPAST